MPSEEWSTQRLAGARLRTDREVGDLVCRMNAGSNLGPTGYNRLLWVMDWYLNAPELLAVAQSPLVDAMKDVPPEFVDFFDPQALPDWVDEEKLARASLLWEQNTLSLLFILYVASLPACYLLHRGIPALFRTRKLADRKYLPQRLFETGLMLDAVLDEDGLRVIQDHADGQAKLGQAAIEASGMASEVEWKHLTFVRKNGGPVAPGDPVLGRLYRAKVALASGIHGQRYVWGRGVVSSRKVRFLHGFMRELLLHPPPGGPQEAWNEAELGAPINQEDQAYTLLTFGYVMPFCLEKLGRRLSTEDREAFLHRWRLVGHLMGIEPGLMTDRWEEAERLFGTIRNREAGLSDEGQILASTLLSFLEELLPDRLSLNTVLPVQFVAFFLESLGGRPEDVLNSDLLERRRNLWGRVSFLGVRAVMRCGYWVRDLLGRLIPGSAAAVRGVMHPLAETLVKSCWAGYARQPFYLPTNLTQWVRDPGADHAFREELRIWRRRLFDMILTGVGAAAAGVLLVLTGLVLACLQQWWPASVVSLAGLALLWLFGALVQWWIPAVAEARPKPKPPPPCEAEPSSEKITKAT